MRQFLVAASALALAEKLTLILLANSEELWWDNPLDRAEIQKSPFVAAFLEHFTAPRKR